MTTKKILIIALIIILAIQLPVSHVVIAEERQETKPEEACKSVKPDFEKLYTELASYLKKNKTAINQIIFGTAFRNAQMQYHKYTECIFNFAEEKILRNKGSRSGGTFMANTPNLPNFNWMDPPAACLQGKELNKVFMETNPGNMLPPLLENHQKYSAHLKKLLSIYQETGIEKGEKNQEISGSRQLIIKSGVYGRINKQVEYELENSLVAMDITFISLKELRLAFVMHVQFQCMMNNLEKYRKLMEDIRIIVDSLPGLLENASIHK